MKGSYDEKLKSGYENVSVEEEEDAEELLSSTEVDDSDSVVADEERQWHSPPKEFPKKQTRTRQCIAGFRKNRWLIDTLLLLVNMSLSILLLRDYWQESERGAMQVGGDFAGRGPDLKFAADEAFVPNDTSKFFSGEVLAKWNTMMPAGTGWSSVSDETFFTTSMTHQLHCVFMMARIFSALTSDRTDMLPVDYHSHYLHCVDYLRQGVMCSADLALEPHEQTDADDNGPLDGSWNGHHVCKDYSHVIPFLEEQIAEGIRTVLPIDD